MTVAWRNDESRTPGDSHVHERTRSSLVSTAVVRLIGGDGQLVKTMAAIQNVQ